MMFVKLPWNQKYLVIGFHALAMFGAMYALKLLLDGAAYILASLPDFLQNAAAFFGWLFDAFSPLLIGLVIAYLLDPAVDFFQNAYDGQKIFLGRSAQKKPALFKRRTAGTILTVLTAILVMAAFIGWTAHKLHVQRDFLSALADAADKSRNQFSETYTGFQVKLREIGLLQFLSGYLTQIINSVALFLQSLISGALASLTSAGSSIVHFAFGLLVAFYLMRSKVELLHGLNDLIAVFLPGRFRKRLRNAVGDVHHILYGYIRGQLIDALIMALLISCWLSIIGVDFAVIIGVFTGFSNIIPYFGAFFGLLLSVAVAFLSGDPMKAVYAGVGVLVLQQIDGMVINPRIVGKNVELSPLCVILALSAASSLFGIAGMILAVPVCAIAKLFLARYIAYKKAGNPENENQENENQD
ncbi:MAG: AI-2E family transporter [Clostridiales bacterium]|jgi:predicted PurR-regulated permease PerM|nr:AI-2E family transporter [Clostridiales bacterium]